MDKVPGQWPARIMVKVGVDDAAVVAVLVNQHGLTVEGASRALAAAKEAELMVRFFEDDSGTRGLRRGSRGGDLGALEAPEWWRAMPRPLRRFVRPNHNR
jgi:hypothetical protein